MVNGCPTGPFSGAVFNNFNGTGVVAPAGMVGAGSGEVAAGLGEGVDTGTGMVDAGDWKVAAGPGAGTLGALFSHELSNKPAKRTPGTPNISIDWYFLKIFNFISPT
ncbi:MAG: hypothetical protein Q8P44_06275 [Dehalococcoidia bacterium]|nr:hypothetical protein [Dehalococcoidia bacterium]